MNFLKQHWDKIQPEQQEMGVLSTTACQGFMRPWNSDMVNIQMLLSAISILKPQKVIELGTFEGATTMEIAKTMEGYSDQDHTLKSIFTFDGGAPVSCYGDGKSVVENWEKDPQWKEWKRVKEARDERMNREFDRIILHYIEGLTQDTLPDYLSFIGHWDFCYQDSVHGLELIIGEWENLKQISRPGSVIVFDDIVKDHPLREWFPANNPDWEWRCTNKGRGQLWCERVK